MQINTDILIVEDEPNLGHTLREYLSSVGHIVHLAATVNEAEDIFQKFSPKIILMDIQLPDGDGLSLARDLRKLRQDFVLLFLSAQNDPALRVEGLEIGAQDYITKPFELKELRLRLDRIISFQKSLFEQPQEIIIGKLKINFPKYELIDFNQNVIPLSQKECAILRILFLNKDNVVARHNIISEVWGDDLHPSTRTVDNYIVKLRKWCETDPSQKLTISSIRGVGYKLTIKE